MALPIEFIARTRALLGEEYDKLEAALQADVPVSIRINQRKGTKAPETSPVAWTDQSSAWIFVPPREGSPLT